MSSARTSTLRPALLAGAVFGLLVLGLSLAHQGHVSALMMLPEKSACYSQSGAPPGVAVFPEAGYDGHLFYYIARDLKMETGCAGAYRYQRILYPALIWLFSFGREGLMPLMMSLINIAAIAAGTWLMSRWLAELGQPAWLGLFYGLSLGHVIIVQYALSGALSLTLALAGAYLFLQRRRVVWAAVFFSLALLTRETASLLWVPLIIWAAWKKEWPATLILILAVLPYLAWEAVLWQRFGELPLFSTNTSAITLNLAGVGSLLSHINLGSGLREAFRTSSSLPYLAFVLICLGLSLWALFKRYGLFAWLTLFSAGVVLFLSPGQWEFISGVGRLSVALVPVSILLAIRIGGRARALVLGWLGAMFIIGLLRIVLAGTHAFFIQA